MDTVDYATTIYQGLLTMPALNVLVRMVTKREVCCAGDISMHAKPGFLAVSILHEVCPNVPVNWLR